ncbi:glycyl-tRNA synthetase [Physcia stellaris]|nr:glycyl-tRNA synthetase [Physcia stellaris]
MLSANFVPQSSLAQHETPSPETTEQNPTPPLSKLHEPSSKPNLLPARLSHLIHPPTNPQNVLPPPPAPLLPLCRASPNHPLSRALSTTPAHRIAKMTIVGRLADDPEEVPTSTGNPMIKYALGTSAGPKDNRTTTWWKVACFTQTDGLRNLMMGLGKGSMVYIEGDASMRKFTTPEGGEKQALSIVQRQIDVLEKRDPSHLESSEGQIDVLEKTEP